MLKWLLFLIPAICLAQSDSKMLRSSNTIPDGNILVSDQSYGPRYVRDSGIAYSYFTNVVINGSNAWLYILQNSNNWNRINGAAFLASNQVFTATNGFSGPLDVYVQNWPSTNASAYRLFANSTPADYGSTNVVLLLHANGANTSTSFPDDSGNNRIVVANGDAKVSTTSPKIGSGSAIFDGAGDYLSCTNTTTWNFGTSDFSIESWINPNGVQADFAGLISAYIDIGDSGWAFLYNNGVARRPSFYHSGTYYLSISNPIPAGTWTHVAFVRVGNTMKAFTNGVIDGQADVTAVSFGTGKTLTIGRLASDRNNYYFKGNLDEIIISKGASRYTNSFTPPTFEYTNSSSATYKLYAIGPDGSTNQIAPSVGGSASVDTNSIVSIATNAAQSNAVLLVLGTTNIPSGFVGISNDVASMDTRTSLWNQAILDSTSWTNWWSTNTLQSQITAINNQTASWNTASINAAWASNGVVTLNSMTNNFVLSGMNYAAVSNGAINLAKATASGTGINVVAVGGTNTINCNYAPVANNSSNIYSSSAIGINTNANPITFVIPSTVFFTPTPAPNGQFILDMFSVTNAPGLGSTFRGWTAGGIWGNLSAPLADYMLMNLAGGGASGVTFKTVENATIQMLASGDWNTTNNSTYIKFQTTQQGTTSQGEAMRIQHDKTLKLFDMSGPPRTTPSGGAYLFSSNGNMYVENSSAAITKISPHNEAGELVIDSENQFTGVREIVNITLLAQCLESLLPKESPYKGKLYQLSTNSASIDWNANETAVKAKRDAEISQWKPTDETAQPIPYVKRPIPVWIQKTMTEKAAMQETVK